METTTDAEGVPTAPYPWLTTWPSDLSPLEAGEERGGRRRGLGLVAGLLGLIALAILLFKRLGR